MDVESIAAQIVHRSDPRLVGWRDERVRAAVAAGTLVLLHRGWYVRGDLWSRWFEEQRHVARVLSTFGAMRGADAAASHDSAVAMHGWPLYRWFPQRVHLTGPRLAGGVRADASTSRHRGPVVDPIVIAGVAVTNPITTVGDVIGKMPLETAVAIADAALRDSALRDPVEGQRDNYDRAAAEQWRSAVLQTPGLRPGARGVAQARWVVAFADGRAQLPGESVSRLYLHLLGFEPPHLQVVVALGAGRSARLDFGMDDIDSWGEFDGTGKYTDPTMLGGGSTAGALIAEKWREDQIRGVTGRRILRWGSAHIRSLADFRTRLASFHVPLPGPRARIMASAPSSSVRHT